MNDKFASRNWTRRYSGAVLLSDRGELLLQQRDSRPDIVNPGGVTLFGGTAAEGESDPECLLRELKEELELEPDAAPAFLGHILKTEQDGTVTRCAIFLLADINTDELRQHEGVSIFRTSPETFRTEPKLSETARQAIELFRTRL